VRKVALMLIALAMIGVLSPAGIAAHSMVPGTDLSSISACELSGSERIVRCTGNRLTILTFVAFWCDTYKSVMEGYTHLQQELQGAPLDYMLLFIDRRSMDLALPLVREQQQKNGTMAIYYDGAERLKDLYDIDSVPLVTIIDRSGRVAYVSRGYPSHRVLRNVIYELQKNGIPEK
jgi:hypothetical protein